MSKIDEIEKEITELTDQLRQEKPTVYSHLQENPQTLPDENNIDFEKALNEYKNHLKDQLNNK
jgi:thiamine pyrophosphokinase